MRLVLFMMAAAIAEAHAPVTPELRGPLTTRGSRIVDAAGETVLLRGVALPTIDAATPATLGVIRVRANMNAVRIPVTASMSASRIAGAVTLANAAGLTAVVSLDAGLPGDGAVAFWRTVAAELASNPRVVFSICRRPRADDWAAWRTAMQRVVEAIRGAGARQLIAASIPHGAAGFDGLTPLDGENLIYEFHPRFEFGALDAQLAGWASRVPVYAGEWGIDLRVDDAECRSLPADPRGLADLLFEQLVAFDQLGISWTASTFAAGSLIGDTVDYLPTVLDRPWICGVAADPQPGMGEVLMVLATGDPTGFGSLRAGQIANAAGGPESPAAPGQLLTIYTEQLGPDPPAAARFDDRGELPRSLDGTRVEIDGEPAPLIVAGAYGITVQMPYTLEAGRKVALRVIANDVPSNRVEIGAAPVAVELFHDPSSQYLIALNEDGSANGPANPARAGSIVVLFGSGGGQTAPGGVTGRAAPPVHPRFAAAFEVTVGGRPGGVLFAGEVPGFAGLAQFNVKLPDRTGSGARPVVIRSGAWTSRAPALLWVRD